MRFKQLLFVALAGCLLSNPMRYDASAQEPADQGQDEPSQPPEPSELPAIRDAVERIARAQEAERDRRESQSGDQTAAEDLKAQQDMAFWAQAMFFATLATVALGGGSLWALIWTFNQQRNLTKAETRAYVRINGARLLPGGGGTFVLVLAIENTGQTVAPIVEGAINFLYVPERTDDGVMKQQSVESFYDCIVKDVEHGRSREIVISGIDGAVFEHLPRQFDPRSLYGSEMTRPHLVLLQGVLNCWDVYGSYSETSLLFHSFSINEGVETTLSTGMGWYGDQNHQ